MAIELPGELVWVMNLLGLNWPAVNEDKVREFAGHVRAFAANVDSTHMAATATVQKMGEAYQAASYDQLVQRWAEMSSGHMTELVEVCNTTATVLDVAADAVVAAKLSVIAELGVMAGEFVADQAAAVLTFGAAEAAEALLIEATKKIVNGILNQLEQQIVGELIDKAVAPLEAVVEKAVGGLAFREVGSILGVPTGGGGVGPGFSVHPDELVRHAVALDGHGDEVAGHARTFAAATVGMTFSG